MSAVIIGGNECVGRTCCDLCARYDISARASFGGSEGHVHSRIRKRE